MRAIRTLENNWAGNLVDDSRKLLHSRIRLVNSTGTCPLASAQGLPTWHLDHAKGVNLRTGSMTRTRGSATKLNPLFSPIYTIAALRRHQSQDALERDLEQLSCPKVVGIKASFVYDPQQAQNHIPKLTLFTVLR
mmetsp:Transcript_28051/g.93179  ORF Transcript_28051/g.93179 Transcript_28051/m.93179 type:complete len:135 (+) Transcript_28051:184-588(+)